MSLRGWVCVVSGVGEVVGSWRRLIGCMLVIKSVWLIMWLVPNIRY